MVKQPHYQCEIRRRTRPRSKVRSFVRPSLVEFVHASWNNFCSDYVKRFASKEALDAADEVSSVSEQEASSIENFTDEDDGVAMDM